MVNQSANAFDRVRALVNDQEQHIFTDKRLKPFVIQAEAMVPIIAAYLLAISVGHFDAADRLSVFFVKEFRSLGASNESESRKTENSSPQQGDAASGSQAATTTEKHGSSEAG